MLLFQKPSVHKERFDALQPPPPSPSARLFRGGRLGGSRTTASVGFDYGQSSPSPTTL